MQKTTVKVNQDNDLKFRQGLFTEEEKKKKVDYSSAYGEMSNNGENESEGKIEYFTE